MCLDGNSYERPPRGNNDDGRESDGQLNDDVNGSNNENSYTHEIQIHCIVASDLPFIFGNLFSESSFYRQLEILSLNPIFFLKCFFASHLQIKNALMATNYKYAGCENDNPLDFK